MKYISMFDLEGKSVHKELVATGCQGEKIILPAIGVHDTLTLTLCGTQNTPCPKVAMYCNIDDYLKII